MNPEPLIQGKETFMCYNHRLTKTKLSEAEQEKARKNNIYLQTTS